MTALVLQGSDLAAGSVWDMGARSAILLGEVSTRTRPRARTSRPRPAISRLP